MSTGLGQPYQNKYPQGLPPALPTPGLLSQLRQAILPDSALQSIEKLQDINPSRLFAPPQNYAEGIAQGVNKMINPLNAVLAFAAPEALTSRGLLGAGTRGLIASQGAQAVGQGLGQRLSGVQQTSAQKGEADVNILGGTGI